MPFEGAVLTDTFQMYEEGDTIDLEMFTDNTERILREMETPIHVIVGNPPYSAGQKNANDNNRKMVYKTLDERIATTYVAKIEVSNTLKRSLYDQYIRAFRWASDRIGERGIVSFVTNGSWLDNQAMDGFRKSLVEEFNSIYVFNLRGNARTQGEQRRKEKDNVFGQGTRTPICITMLVKNPVSEEHGAIHYHDIGDYLDREAKLAIVASAVDGEPFEWESLKPDKHGDWLNQRDDAWTQFAPMGLEKLKTPLGIFEMYSSGVMTTRDAWVYNYSQSKLMDASRRMIDFYEEQVDLFTKTAGDTKFVDFADKDEAKIKWNEKLYKFGEKGKHLTFDPEYVELSMYRPFCKQYFYSDPDLSWSLYKQKSLFPSGKVRNLVITMTGKTDKDFSALLVESIVEYLFQFNGNCFPLYWYERKDSLGGLFANDSGEYIRHDAITDEALEVFRKTYPRVFDACGKSKARTKSDGGIELTKEDIFYYIYGILHSPEYRSRFEANLKKELPRIPLAEDFRTFSLAGRKLAQLHLEYESVQPYPLTVRGDASNPGRVQKMKWDKREDPETGKRVNDYTTLIYDENLTFSDIPEDANEYKVNGRSPLEWLIDRYQVKTDKASGIVNDPNDYSDDPTYISGLIPRLVTVSMDTLYIMNGLPPLNEKSQPADWPFAWKAGE